MPVKLKAFLVNYVLAGFSQEHSEDANKHIYLTSLFSLFAFVFMTVFGIATMAKGMWMHGSIVLGIAAIVVLNYLYLRISGNYRFSSHLIVYLMSILCLYLLCTGGDQNTGPLWYLVMPLLIFYVQGFRLGGAVLTVLFLATVAILFIPDNPLLLAGYSLPFKLRIIATFLAVTFLGGVYEFSRQRKIQELMDLNERLKTVSRTDSLTGLPNRRAMTERLRHEMDRSERTEGLFCILIGDIDNFKVINDRYGHECGDAVLKTVATVLDTNTQKRDMVCRWGGEEFFILLPDTTVEGGRAAAERLRKAVEDLRVDWYGRTIRLTISIGVEECGTQCTLDERIREADNNLYKAKNGGRNRVM